MEGGSFGDSSTNACDVCGWIAAVGATIAFGSFGAPIKSKTAKSVDIDPLVFQSYKTIMCFLTSWLVLFFGVPFSFTPWGLVSGIFWVPGGVATVYGVKTAGLAIAMGILSSFIVLVSFTWGIFIFDEHVHSRPGACAAVACMIAGLCGMSYYSSNPTTSASRSTDGMVEYHGIESTEPSSSPIQETITSSSRTVDSIYDDLDESQQQQQQQMQEQQKSIMALRSRRTIVGSSSSSKTETTMATSIASVDNVDDNLNSDRSTNDDELMDHVDDGDDEDPEASSDELLEDEMDSPSLSPQGPQYKVICGMKIKRRILGMMSATFCGVWGGSIMVPVQYAPKENMGIGYLISFAIGAATVTTCIWILRYFVNVAYTGSFVAGYYALPSFHFRKMWLPGGLSGLLWSVGNFCSLLSVKYLGEGVGYSVCQSAMLVSGLWGIFYFQEIKGTQTIVFWFLAASITVFGIILLSYEHHAQ